MSFERDLWESCAPSARAQCEMLEGGWREACSGYHAAICRGDARAEESYARAMEEIEEFYIRLLVWLNWSPVG